MEQVSFIFKLKDSVFFDILLYDNSIFKGNNIHKKYKDLTNGRHPSKIKKIHC